MNRPLIVAAAFLAFNSMATAHAQGSQLSLWGSLQVGMNKSEVERLYPGLKIDITSSCPATIRPRYSDQSLYAVQLSLKGAKCQSMIIDSLMEKYGAPETSDVEMYEGTKKPLSAKKLIWLKDGVQIKLSVGVYMPTTHIFYSAYDFPVQESGADRL